VIAVGEESLCTFTGRTSVATAEMLEQQATVFPSDPAASSAASSDTQPTEAFARRLRDVLDDDT
jgi:hypothetical protein